MSGKDKKYTLNLSSEKLYISEMLDEIDEWARSQSGYYNLEWIATRFEQAAESLRKRAKELNDD